MGKTRLLAVATCVAAVAGAGATGALAGEIKGPPYQGAPVPGGIANSTNSTAAAEHSNSVCSFSGLNDFDSFFGQVDRQTQTPKDAAPGSAAHGWQTPFGLISCNPHGPVG